MNTFTNIKKQKIHCQPDVHVMGYVERTQGDGMENATVDRVEIRQSRSRLGDTLIYHPTNLKKLGSTSPVTPIGTIVKLVPKNISNIKQEKHILHSLKSKDPKFIPYEPYKAAVNPIVPFEKKKKLKKKSSLNATVAQIAALKIQDNDTKLKDCMKESKAETSEDEWNNEKRTYESEIRKLKEENNQLETQLKFQVQVNGELKNLLVAAVGEDLETRVHLLTEDKLQLARALLNSAKHLSTHQEQIEWLAGQCEVWRSKFLASSLMVEDLARWKAALCQRTTELQETIKRLLEEHITIRDTLFKTYRMLTILREKFDSIGTTSGKKHELISTNIVDLTQGCCQLVEILRVSLLSGIPDSELQKELNITGLDMKTLAENNAEKLLNKKLPMTERDVACTAVMGAAVAVGGQMFLPRCNASNMTYCPHCSGEIKQI
ncbi:golgin-45 isoform X1 [Mycetomoellerius zeteki]|uniref:golgin-45 isoform X1 n=1 Tax=Mycetomoellerius zeteki TaxID=64791 RepID=UPI00084ECF3F|nr:PREDICTED: golgin-45 isoform X1 [Trachymyrmex zeteki]XP_018315509.1 PREDICTED: golgin-45 isoform X1 [Trachymyrmex zeteki]